MDEEYQEIMSMKVGINGFGNRGRSILRLLLCQQEIEVTHINDKMDIPLMAYLLQFDTPQAEFMASIEYDDSHLIVNNHPITITRFADNKDIPWEKSGTEYVIETSVLEDNYAKLQQHLKSTVKCVILGGLPCDHSIPTMVMGVNEMRLQDQEKIIASACGTTQCVSLMLKVLHEEFGIAHAFMNSVQSLNTNMVERTDYRQYHSTANSIVPIPSPAIRGVQMVLPELKSVFDGITTEVPCVGGYVELTAELHSSVTTRVVKDAFCRYADGPLNSFLEYCSAPMVSNNVIHNPHSAVFDECATKVIDGRFIQILCWFDSEYIHSLRIIDLLKYVHNL